MEVKNEMPQSIGIVKCIELRDQQRVYVLSIDGKDVTTVEWTPTKLTVDTHAVLTDGSVSEEAANGTDYSNS